MMIPLRLIERSCGGCQACCSTLKVDNKPMWSRCKYQCETGCSVYQDRPQACRDYFCLWQIGVMEEDCRPDKFGVLFDLRVASSDVPVISAWELWTDAIEQPHVKALLEKLGEDGVVYVRRFNSSKRRVFGPPKLLSGMTIQELS
jgi:Fe-S-cluster containining protein